MRHRQHTNKFEIRTAPEEMRVSQDASGNRTVSGYAVLWNTPSNDLGFIEKVTPGAFKDSLAANDVRLLKEHKPEMLLARTSSGTLTLAEDQKGLKFAATLPNSPLGQDVAESLERRDLQGMSFGFRAIKQAWGKNNGQATRTLHKCALSEISIVGNPAYAQTSVDLRSIPEEYRSLVTRSNDDGCECDCDACMDDDCDNCSMADCEDAQCAENGCPAQDGERSMSPEPEDIARYMRLELKRRA
jgi:HK97 family phage prohead protease